MGFRSFKGLPRSYQITIAAFEGAAISLIAFDFSDYFNYLAQAGGHALSPAEQAFYYAILPTGLYIFLAVAAYALALTGRVKAEFFLWFVLFTFVLAPTFLGLLLPQSTNLVFFLTLVLGAIASSFIMVGLIGQVKGVKKR